MKTIYKCDTCGKESQQMYVIAECEASHAMKPQEFVEAIFTALGEGTIVDMSKVSGLEKYEVVIKIDNSLIVFKEFVHTIEFNMSTVNKINKSIDAIRKSLSIRPVVKGNIKSVLPDLEELSRLTKLQSLNENKKFFVQIGVE